MIYSNDNIPRSSHHLQQQQQQQLPMNKKTNLNQDLELLIKSSSSNNNKNEETKQDQQRINNTIIDEDENKPRRKSFDFIRRFSFGKESLSLRASRRKHASKKTLEVDELKSKQNENVPDEVHNAKEESRVGDPIFTKCRSNRSRRVAKRDSLYFVRRYSDENSFVPRQPLPTRFVRASNII
eukprot:CAMPEP_0178978356 /NCGR_PEP_ID=MMETSP0789-20121207/25103_1 /TAXON_ID=3005 /ORGANISM="Rhizosolenia setigera, Strain CCMP 1694" /LENGTH=181 /DNA_ID=CAMNT_0020668065 /DNA_START=66 /DNA_END=611 /DNA_ORIENTATION=+